MGTATSWTQRNIFQPASVPFRSCYNNSRRHLHPRPSGGSSTPSRSASTSSIANPQQADLTPRHPHHHSRHGSGEGGGGGQEAEEEEGRYGRGLGRGPSLEAPTAQAFSNGSSHHR